MLINDYAYERRVSEFMTGVYGWMSCALAISAGVAYYISITPRLFFAVQQPAVLIALCIGQLAFVIGISFFLKRLSFIVVLLLFLLYSVSLGITLSSIFYVYTQSSIMATFLVTALTFGIMSLYGYITHSDLTAIGNMSFMFLIGIVIGLLINMFLQSSSFDYFLSACGVIIFVLLTAYDTQKIKQFARPFLIEDNEVLGKITIMGALMLYLDFINLFLFLLRFLGKRREE